MSAPGYLAAGFRRADGTPRPGLAGALALEGARHLWSLGITAAHLEPLLAQVVKGQEPSKVGPAGEFLSACLAAAPVAADRAPLVEHLGAVLRLLALEEAVHDTGLGGPPPVPPAPRSP